MKTAIIYCRVSTDKQGHHGESLEAQERECRAYCERMHITVVEVFCDQFTGTSIQRPALNEALSFLKKQKKSIDYCIIHKIDRSTRGGLGDYYEIKKRLEECGTTLKDAYGIIQDDIRVVNIDNFDAGIYDWSKINPSEIAVSMTVLTAKQERATILQRTITQEIRNTQNGYISRQSHFGYQNEKICTPEGKLKVVYIPEPIESVWIQKLFDLRANQNLSDSEITDIINSMGYISRTQKRWDKNHSRIIGTKGGKKLDVKQLQLYIQNPIYAGIMKEKWTGNRAIRASFAGLVSIDTFNRANRGKVEIVEHSAGGISVIYGEERLNEKPHYQRLRFNSEYPFSRVIKCPHCEGHLTPNKSTSGNGTLHYYYQCKGKFGKKHKNYTVRREVLNNTVLNFLDSIEYDPEKYKLMRIILREIWSEKKHDIKESKLTKEDEIRELENTKISLLRNIEKFIDYPEILREKNDELKELTKRIELLKKTPQESSHETHNEESFIEFSNNLFKHIENMLQQEKSEEKVGIVFNLLFEESPTFENIQSNKPQLFPVFRLASKKRAIDDSLIGMNNDGNTGWQLCSESNGGQRLWRPLH